jgi:hypothetical protein
MCGMASGGMYESVIGRVNRGSAFELTGRWASGECVRESSEYVITYRFLVTLSTFLIVQAI